MLILDLQFLNMPSQQVCCERVWGGTASWLKISRFSGKREGAKERKKEDVVFIPLGAVWARSIHQEQERCNIATLLIYTVVCFRQGCRELALGLGQDT